MYIPFLIQKYYILGYSSKIKKDYIFQVDKLTLGKKTRLRVFYMI